MKLFKLKNIYNPRKNFSLLQRFSNKESAKARRDELNGGLETGPDRNRKWKKDKGWRVTIAEDHWRYAAST